MSVNQETNQTSSLSRVVSDDCTNPEFLEAVESLLRRVFRLSLPLNQQIVSLVVSDAEASTCSFSFEIEIRRLIK